MEPTFDETDPLLEDLLKPKPYAQNDDLQKQIYQQTIGYLGYRNRMNRIQWIAGLAACFMGGILVANWFRPEPITITEYVYLPAKESEVKESEPTLPRKRPAELELEGEKALVGSESAKLFREAGDLYLREEGNYQAALRCYRNFLDEASPSDLTPSNSDTWLLNSLKEDRLTEVRNVKN
jgi:hypothetical protein